MNRRLGWLLFLVALLYFALLATALLVGSNTVRVAVIAVGGTAVGAIAGLMGSIIGARTQAVANLETTRAQLDANRRETLLQEQLRWVGKAYDELADLLGAYRDLGVTVGQYENWADVVVKLQQIVTHADLLGTNPLVVADPELRTRLLALRKGITSSLYEDWRVAQGETPTKRDKDWVPAGQLGTTLAEGIGEKISQIVASGIFEHQAS